MVTGAAWLAILARTGTTAGTTRPCYYMPDRIRLHGGHYNNINLVRRAPAIGEHMLYVPDTDEDRECLDDEGYDLVIIDPA